MAKTPYLVRHAKSSWTDMQLSDFDRPLNQRGLRGATRWDNGFECGTSNRSLFYAALRSAHARLQSY